jgi:predicted transcriptional regulator
MSKTNKEIAAEITCAYVSSWNSNSENKAMQPNELTGIINKIYDAVSKIPE